MVTIITIITNFHFYFHVINIILYFIIGGKKCPTCGQRIYHEKWGVSDKLAEERWAHQQARARELAEVEDFFN